MSRHCLFIIALLFLLILSIVGISFGWELILQGQIQETFDDNITSSISDKKYDFLSEFTVALGVRHEGKTQTLEIIGHIVQQVYGIHFGLTNNAQDVTLSYNKAFSDAISFQVSDMFQNYPEPDTFEALFGNTQGRMRYWRNNFSITGLFELNKHYVINITYTNQFSKFFYTHTRQWYIYNYYSMNYSNQELKYTLNHTARIRHEIHWDSSNNSYLYYEYQWTKNNPGGILQVHRPGIGYRHDFTKQLFVEGRISPDIVFPPEVTLTNVTAYGVQMFVPPKTPYDVSLFANLIVSHDVDKKTNALLQFTYQNSVIANNADPTTNWQIQGDVSRHIFERLLLTSSIFYGEAYLFTSKTTNRLFGFSIRTAYEFTENISASISYNFTLNYSHVDGYRVFGNYVYNNGAYLKEDSGYLRNRVSLGVIAEF